MITDSMRARCYKRSYSRCEAMVLVPGSIVEKRWTRCGKRPVEVHHAITRSRGGGILDRVEEDYHLIVLCPDCHRAADGMAAYEGGLLLSGYVEWNADKTWPVYVGEDEYLKTTYPRESNDKSQGSSESVSAGEARHASAREVARGQSQSDLFGLGT